LNFLVRFSKNIQTSGFRKIDSKGAELFHAPGGRTDRQTNRRTDMAKIIVGLRNFSKQA